MPIAAWKRHAGRKLTSRPLLADGAPGPVEAMKPVKQEPQGRPCARGRESVSSSPSVTRGLCLAACVPEKRLCRSRFHADEAEEAARGTVLGRRAASKPILPSVAHAFPHLPTSAAAASTPGAGSRLRAVGSGAVGCGPWAAGPWTAGPWPRRGVTGAVSSGS